MNDRLFNMFDKRKSARVSLEDVLHALHVLSGDSKKDKLTCALLTCQRARPVSLLLLLLLLSFNLVSVTCSVSFKAFDMGNKGFVTLGEMASGIKDITSTRTCRACEPLVWLASVPHSPSAVWGRWTDRYTVRGQEDTHARACETVCHRRYSLTTHRWRRSPRSTSLTRLPLSRGQ
jgi:hypothetical protein